MSRILSLSLATLVFLVGCSSGSGTPQIIGSGIVITEARDVTGFSGVVLAAPFGTVRVRQGATESVVIQAEDNVVPAISTAVVNNVLVVDFISGTQVLPTRSVIVDVMLIDVDVLGVSGIGLISALDALTAGADVSLFVSSLAGGVRLASLTAGGDVELEISGVGDISADSLTADSLSVTIGGVGGVDISGGSVVQQTITATGTVAYDTVDLVSTTASFDFSGTGEIRLQFINMLTGEISGGGTVFYRGDPALVDVNVINGNIEQLV